MNVKQGEITVAITYDGLWNVLSYRNIKTVDLRKQAQIAPDTMAKLKNNEKVSLSVLRRICNVLKCNYCDIINYVSDSETNNVETFSINNRRYLGNKYKLIPFIEEIVNNHCSDIYSVADIFSGTGAVASAFCDRKLITNDLLYSNYICNYAWFNGNSFDRKKIIRLITEFNAVIANEDNYMTEHFSDTYFSRSDCAKIGFVREKIEKLYKSNQINERERAILIMSLIYAMDKIANTCGHYDAYIQDIDFDKHLVLALPNVNPLNNPLNHCYNEDANELVKKIYADLVYLDPPYNSRQYCDSYHLLENVARWEKPDVHGVARKMDRTALKSRYCTKSAETAFTELISNIRARYILLSYNNMANKGNERSNAKISDEIILSALEKKEKYKCLKKNIRLLRQENQISRIIQSVCFSAPVRNYIYDTVTS